MISLAKPHMTKSRVVDDETGGTKESRFEHCPNANFRPGCYITCDVMMLILLDGGIYICSARTSSGMLLNRGQDKVIRRIEKRKADYTSIPVGM